MRAIRRRNLKVVPSRGTTVRISSHSHGLLKELAASTGRSLQDELEDAIEEKRRRLYLDGLNADYASLKQDADADADFKKELAVWEVTNLDGLEGH